MGAFGSIPSVAPPLAPTSGFDYSRLGINQQHYSSIGRDSSEGDNIPTALRSTGSDSFISGIPRHGNLIVTN